MKTKLSSLVLAGICSVPSFADAQVNCIAGPGGSSLCAIAITTNGNVGIGTQPNDDARLHVNGNVFIKNSLTVRNGITVSTSYEGLRFQNSAGGKLDWFCGAQPDNSFRIYEDAFGGPVARLFIAPGGKVGVGTSAPDGLLSLSGRYPQVSLDNPERGAGTHIVFKDAGEPRGAIGHLNRTAGLQFSATTASQPAVTIDQLGRVGVGITHPEAALHVVGKIVCEVLEVTSDRNAKSNFKSLNLSHALEKLAALEISEWEYTNAPGVRHYGPMAQDFHRAFGLGSDDKQINPLDAASVALAGVLALTQEL